MIKQSCIIRVSHAKTSLVSQTAPSTVFSSFRMNAVEGAVWLVRLCQDNCYSRVPIFKILEYHCNNIILVLLHHMQNGWSQTRKHKKAINYQHRRHYILMYGTATCITEKYAHEGRDLTTRVFPGKVSLCHRNVDEHIVLRGSGRFSESHDQWIPSKSHVARQKTGSLIKTAVDSTT